MRTLTIQQIQQIIGDSEGMHIRNWAFLGAWGGVIIEREGGDPLAMPVLVVKKEEGAWHVVEWGTGFLLEDWIAVGAPELLADYLAGGWRDRD